MDTIELKRWKRVEEIALACGVTISLKDLIGFTDSAGLNLGYFSTVAEAYAFICGYEHKSKDKGTTAFTNPDWKEM